MLVPIPLVMRGVPAQIFFAVRSTILCKSNLSLISLQAVVRWSKRQSAASGQKGLIRTFTFHTGLCPHIMEVIGIESGNSSRILNVRLQHH